MPDVNISTSAVGNYRPATSRLLDEEF